MSTYSIIHCKSEEEAVRTLEMLDKRLNECKITLHPDKTKIVYCKDKDRTKKFPNQEFDFLGYTFRRMFIKDRTGRLQFNFLPSVSQKAAKSFREKDKGYGNTQTYRPNDRNDCRIDKSDG